MERGPDSTQGFGDGPSSGRWLSCSTLFMLQASENSPTRHAAVRPHADYAAFLTHPRATIVGERKARTLGVQLCADVGWNPRNCNTQEQALGWEGRSGALKWRR
eukprot:2583175-Rhodomonas_salina.2